MHQREIPSVTRAAGDRVAIAVHGGAGDTVAIAQPAAQRRQAFSDLRRALGRGHAILDRGGSSVEAVRAAVVELEDAALFNAGLGSVLNAEGRVEMDAAVMCGEGPSAGAVGAVRTVKNPVLLADLVRTETSHVMLVGDGAEAFAKTFAKAKGVVFVAEESLVTERRRQEWLENCAASDSKPSLGTVGAVALDRAGVVATATSTGGMVGKLPGRIGDSPIIGAGTYANGRCAVSATGNGEIFMRLVAAYELCRRVTSGEKLAEAADRLIREMPPGAGGLIAIDADGNLAMPFNTRAMYRGYVDVSRQLRVGVLGELSAPEAIAEP